MFLGEKYVFKQKKILGTIFSQSSLNSQEDWF
jgi:hypothetical protein